MGSPPDLASMFRDTVRNRPRPDAFLLPKNGRYEPVPTEEVASRVRRVAGGLRRLGVKKGSKVALLSYNRLEWVLVDYACLLLGAVTVPLYSTSAAAQIEFILKDSRAGILFAETPELLGRIGSPPDGIEVFLFEGEAPEGVRKLEDLEKEGGEEEPQTELSPEDVATLLYTSGTTGTPKGVILTHGNLMSNVVASAEVIGIGPTDTVLSFLPVSHVFERTVDYVTFYQGGRTAYPPSMERVLEALQGARPTVVPAVPRFFEKLRTGVHRLRDASPPVRRRLIDWALKIATEVVRRKAAGRKVPEWLKIRRALADRIVLSKIRERAGGRVRMFISGGAPLSREVGEFLEACGFTVIEGYGLTESSPVIAVNPPSRPKLGTVGPPIRGVEVKIAEDGEVLVRGPNVMKGYYNRPEETEQTLKDGWLHTGDIGEFDEDGYLRITDRKKDLFKTSGGKYIAPQPIENRLKLDPHVALAVVLGAGRPFPSVLIAPDFAALKEKFGEASEEELCGKPEVRELFQKLIDQINEELSQPEQIKRFELIPEELTIEAGDLTPTMKVRRRIVEEKHRDRIESIYGK